MLRPALTESGRPSPPAAIAYTSAMAIPRLAIIGRPNVGKSSLMNLLARERASIVDPTPGVTRDRVTRLVELKSPDKIQPPKLVEVTDTGGYGVYNEAGKQINDVGEDLSRLTDDIEMQIAEAIVDAQLILFVVDAQTGITPLDETVARLLRERDVQTPVMLIANKVDSEKWEPHAFEASSLGLGEPMLISAAHNYRRREFLDRLYESLPDTSDELREQHADQVKIAIVGKRNAGKSTLTNALAGSNRMIVSDIAGTTRDAVDVQVEVDGVKFIAIDTAGLRKRKSLEGDVEWYAYQRSLGALRRADVALFLLDATTEVSQVDKAISKEIARLFKPVVIVVNKWDEVERLNETRKKQVEPESYMDYLDQELAGLRYAPVVFISAREQDGLTDMLKLAFELHRQASHRETTSRLNDVFREILDARGPTSKLGTQAKIYYASQIDVCPPTIAIMVNKPDLFTDQYQRYLLNALRARLPWEEVPVRLVFRSRTRADLKDLLSGAHRSAQRGEAKRGREGEALLPGRRIKRGNERAIEAPPLTDEELRRLDEGGAS
jgi:GTP-binding protein